MAAETSRTTLTLPTELPRAIDRAVHEGQARSRGELVAAALRRELAIRERAAIDAAFAALADDREYQAEALAIEAEFERADAEALRLAEGEE
jgi:Arc/MetJ-type ribon-helix-helix transcriptional regulator